MLHVADRSAHNDNDSDKLSPVGWRYWNSTLLINFSQPELDEEAFIADLLKGTMKMTSHYIMNNGKFEELLVDGGTIPCVQTVFLEDETCRDCHTEINLIGENGAPSDWIDTYSEYDWRYDGDALVGVITHAAYDITSAEGDLYIMTRARWKVLYYNTDNNRPDTPRRERIRTCFGDNPHVGIHRHRCCRTRTNP